MNKNNSQGGDRLVVQVPFTLTMPEKYDPVWELMPHKLPVAPLHLLDLGFGV